MNQDYDIGRTEGTLEADNSASNSLCSKTYRPIADYFLVKDGQDLRGRAILAEDGTETATVSDMLVDPDLNRVALIELSDGRRLPIEQIRLHGNYIRIAA